MSNKEKKNALIILSIVPLLSIGFFYFFLWIPYFKGPFSEHILKNAYAESTGVIVGVERDILFDASVIIKSYRPILRYSVDEQQYHLSAKGWSKGVHRESNEYIIRYRVSDPQQAYLPLNQECNFRAILFSVVFILLLICSIMCIVVSIRIIAEPSNKSTATTKKHQK